MSYIHKALKKAQKEKEARNHQYQSVVSTPGYKPRLFSGKALWLICFFLIPLAVAVYLWLPSTSSQPTSIESTPSRATAQQPARSEPAQPKATPQRARSEPVQPKATPQPPQNETEQPKTTAREPAETGPSTPKPTTQPQNMAQVKTLYEKARVFHKGGHLQEAMRLYEKALSLDPDHVEALNNMGVIHIQSRRYPAAEASFEKAIRLRPDYVDSRYNLACLHALQGKVSQSLFHLERAVALNQAVRDWARNDADLMNLRGVPEYQDIVGDGGE
jgi:tetratricopeptide (TPR) repeat protein